MTSPTYFIFFPDKEKAVVGFNLLSIYAISVSLFMAMSDGCQTMRGVSMRTGPLI